MAKVNPLLRSSGVGDLDFSRREFARTVAAAAWASSTPRVPGDSATANRHDSSAAETPVARLFRTLDDDQRPQICFPFAHPLRMRVQNNWAIVKPRIRDLTPEQQALCRDIFKGLCSTEGHQRFLRQMAEDGGGFENYHVALFGAPGTAQPFEWVLTGRHITLRADGHRHEGPTFGGPIFYGHGAAGRASHDPGRAGNAWWYQTEQANAILRSLDERQRAQSFDTGLAISELDATQKPMVRQLLSDLLRPFRNVDAEAILSCLREPSGADLLRLTFSKDARLGNDNGARDIWKLEGPTFAWSFHGTPHVHAWVTVAQRAIGEMPG